MKNRFTGIMNVFKFSYIQTVKSKAFVVVMSIMLCLGLFALPVVTAITRATKDDSEKVNADIIGKVYVCDQVTDGKLAENLVDIIGTSETYKDKECIIVSKDDYENTYDAIKASKNGDVLIDITYDNNPESLNYGFSYVVFYGEKVDDLREASEEFSLYIDGIHNQVIAKTFSQTEEGADLLSYKFESDVVLIDTEGNVVEKEIALDMVQYWVSYGFLMVSIITISILGAKISEQIITEKSSKVIEYIMTSIKPMALITGKVLSSVAIMMTMLFATLASLVGSVFINGALFKEADGSMALPGFVKMLIEENVLEGLNIINVISSLVVFALGFILYAYLAGIAGATVSKVEEMADGLKIFTFAMLIGAYTVITYLASAVAGADWGMVVDFLYVFPLTSPFIVPASLFIGKISIGIALLSVAALVLTIVLLMFFVAAVYEYLIYYNGSPVKIKELIKIVTKKGGAK